MNKLSITCKFAFSGLLIVHLTGCFLPSLSTSASGKDAEQTVHLEENNFQAAQLSLHQKQENLQARLEKLITKLDKAAAKGKPAAEKNLLEKQSIQSELEANSAVIQSLPARSASYVKSELSDIDALRKKGEWRQGDSKLIQVEARALPSQKLENYRSTFDAARNLELANLEHRLLMLESQQLPEREIIYRALSRTGFGEASLYSRLRSEQDLKNRVESSLRERAMRAERDGKLSTALQYLTALARLDDSDEVQADVRRVTNWLASGSRVKNQGSKNSKPSEPSTFEKQYAKALAQEDWLEARTLLDAAMQKNPVSSELKAQDAYLEDKYLQLVETAKAEGEASYTRGEIETALEIWQEALNFAPEDLTLLNNIQRAQKVLDKLEALQSADAGTTAP